MSRYLLNVPELLGRFFLELNASQVWSFSERKKIALLGSSAIL